MRHALLFAILAVFLAPLPAAESPLTLEASTDREMYREAARNEIYVEARLRGGPSATAPARNLAFVIDRSGSMAGEPIAALRQAVSAALNSLAAADIAAVVVFGSEVETLIEARARAEMGDPAARLAPIEPAGGAALYDALNQGAAQLRRHAAPDIINHLILVTDGPPTKGPREFVDFIRLAEAFATEGITLSTIGLGEEFDEDMLSAMARSGHGRFRFAREPSALDDALRAELAWNPVVLGHDAVLHFEFPRSSRQVEPHGWRPAIVTRTTVAFRFPRLYAAHDFGVLASTELDAAAAQVFLPNVVTVRLQWKTADGLAHELSRTLPAHFTTDSIAIRPTPVQSGKPPTPARCAPPYAS
jgi:Ca-activated chloride channel homolog